MRPPIDAEMTKNVDKMRPPLDAEKTKNVVKKRIYDARRTT